MLVLISLQSADLRYRHMAAQFDALSIAFERVGFDGRTRPADEIRMWCAERFGSIRFDFDQLSGAEAGCWISHLLAWDRLRHDRSATVCTVIEDDLILEPGFAESISALEKPSPFDVVYLGTSSRNISTRRRARVGCCWVHEPIGTVFNTWGYVISRSYVERFFAEPSIYVRVPIDHFLGGNAREAKPRIAVLCPPAVTENPLLGRQSQIEPHTNRFDRWKLIESARRRLLASRVSTLYYSLYRLL